MTAMASTHAFPFRFGTTSYIIPDEIIPNVEFLKDRVDDIELVLFESDEFSNLPGRDDIGRLSDIADEYGCRIQFIFRLMPIWAILIGLNGSSR